MKRPLCYLSFALIALAPSFSHADLRQCLRYAFEEKARSIKEWTAVKTGTALGRKMDAETFRIFDQVRLDPAWKLTPAQQGHLEAVEMLPLLERYRNSAKWVQELNHKIGLMLRSHPARHRKKGWKRLQDTWKPILEVALPILPHLTYRRVRSIYNDFLYGKYKHWLDLPEKKKKFIRKWNLESDLLRYIDDLQDKREVYVFLTRARKGRSVLKWSLIATLPVLAMAGTDNVISTDDSFNAEHPAGMSKYDEKVELIYFSPLPHVAIRIGGLVPGGQN